MHVACQMYVPEADPVLHGAAGLHGLELGQDGRLATIRHSVKPNQGSLRETRKEPGMVWFGFGVGLVWDYTMIWGLGRVGLGCVASGWVGLGVGLDWGAPSPCLPSYLVSCLSPSCPPLPPS